MRNCLKITCLLLLFFCWASAQTSSLVSIGTNGKLVYTPDSKGKVVPDFSGVGYLNSESSIPTIAVLKTVNADYSKTIKLVVKNNFRLFVNTHKTIN